MKESDIQRQIMIAISKLGHRVFRNQVGLFELNDGRRIRTGLCVGSSDLIGWTSIVIKDTMVGKKVAVFTAIEVKTDKGKTTNEQDNFIEVVKNSGGIAQIVRSVEEINLNI